MGHADMSQVASLDCVRLAANVRNAVINRRIAECTRSLLNWTINQLVDLHVAYPGGWKIVSNLRLCHAITRLVHARPERDLLRSNMTAAAAVLAYKHSACRLRTGDGIAASARKMCRTCSHG